MKRGGLANDNKELDYGVLDPDRHFVADLIAEVCDHFKSKNIDRNTIATSMLDELFKMLDSNPQILADMQFLWRLKNRVVPMSEQWDNGWMRLQKEKRPTFRFNRAARPPVQELPPRPEPLPDPNYSPVTHGRDLRLLHLRRGVAYTEKEVQARYRRQQLKLIGSKTRYRADGRDRVEELAAARRRILKWIRSGGAVNGRETA